MEPTIYKPSIYKGTGIYKNGTSGGGGGGISCIRCNVSGTGNYIEIPVSTSNRAKFEVGFNLCGSWSKKQLGIFSALGTTYHPPIMLSDQNRDNTQYSILCSLFHINSQVSITNQIFPNDFIFYHAEIRTTDTNTFFKLTDLNGNVIENSLGYAVRGDAVQKIKLFVYGINDYGNTAGFEIYYFRVSNNLGNILDLVPSEQNGVPGFTDNVSGNFYAPNNSSAFEAVKARTPL